MEISISCFDVTMTQIFKVHSTFYRDILSAFDEIKTLYNYDPGIDTILFSNTDILVDGKPGMVCIHTIEHLFNENG